MSDHDTPELLRALDDLSKKNWPAAIDVLATLADAGNPKAQCNLATCYQLGLGVQVDGLRAVELYRAVAEKHIRAEHLSAIACNNLAAIYISGSPGVPPDRQKAAEYQERAQSLGFPMGIPQR